MISNLVAATVAVLLTSYLAFVGCHIAGWWRHDPFETPMWAIYIFGPAMSAIVYSQFRKTKN